MAFVDLAEWVRDIFYRVGTYYISADATSPALLRGGTWTQLSAGTFITAAGTDYPTNSTGGAARIMLTDVQIPGSFWTSSKRPYPGELQLLFNAGENYGIACSPDSAPISTVENRPPYIAAYIWKRTA